MDENNDRLTWHKGDVSIYDENGNDITNNDYKKMKQDNTTFKEEIHVGDIVRTKGTSRIIMIKYVDYNINDLFRADYAGVEYNSDNEDLILLGSDDIDVRIFDSSKVSKKFNR